MRTCGRPAVFCFDDFGCQTHTHTEHFVSILNSGYAFMRKIRANINDTCNDANGIMKAVHTRTRKKKVERRRRRRFDMFVCIRPGKIHFKRRQRQRREERPEPDEYAAHCIQPKQNTLISAGRSRTGSSSRAMRSTKRPHESMAGTRRGTTSTRTFSTDKRKSKQKKSRSVGRHPSTASRLTLRRRALYGASDELQQLQLFATRCHIGCFGSTSCACIRRNAHTYVWYAQPIRPFSLWRVRSTRTRPSVHRVHIRQTHFVHGTVSRETCAPSQSTQQGSRCGHATNSSTSSRPTLRLCSIQSSVCL